MIGASLKSVLTALAALSVICACAPAHERDIPAEARPLAASMVEAVLSRDEAVVLAALSADLDRIEARAAFRRTAARMPEGQAERTVLRFAASSGTEDLRRLTLEYEITYPGQEVWRLQLVLARAGGGDWTLDELNYFPR